MNKLLVICGPTSVGKTVLGTHLAKKFGGEIVSADSRQVYKGMDIGTGKDIPDFSIFHFPFSILKGKDIGCYESHGVRIWGYDLVDPREEFSVAHYFKYAKKIIEYIWDRKKLPIVVGGTGLYIKALVDGIETMTIPPDEAQRKELKDKGVDELHERLKKLNYKKAGSLNRSDRNNPRRLIRYIEIEKYRDEFPDAVGKKKFAVDDKLMIGLRLRREELYKRIEDRVEERIRAGFKDEFNTLINKGVECSMQSMKALGYRQWCEYHMGKNTREEAIERWKREERKYAKRQMTWFKKNKRINWYASRDKNLFTEIEMRVERWYSNN